MLIDMTEELCFEMRKVIEDRRTLSIPSKCTQSTMSDPSSTRMAVNDHKDAAWSSVFLRRWEANVAYVRGQIASARLSKEEEMVVARVRAMARMMLISDEMADDLLLQLCVIGKDSPALHGAMRLLGEALDHMPNDPNTAVAHLSVALDTIKGREAYKQLVQLAAICVLRWVRDELRKNRTVQ
jgi:hypothetical protein